MIFYRCFHFQGLGCRLMASIFLFAKPPLKKPHAITLVLDSGRPSLMLPRWCAIPPRFTLFICNHFLFPTDHAPLQWQTGWGLLPDWLSTGWHFSPEPLARRSATCLSNSLFLTATSMRFSFRMQFCKRFAQESIRKGQGESTRMWKDPLPRS